jgi:hypothetical protein
MPQILVPALATQLGEILPRMVRVAMCMPRVVSMGRCDPLAASTTPDRSTHDEPPYLCLLCSAVLRRVLLGTTMLRLVRCACFAQLC